MADAEEIQRELGTDSNQSFGVNDVSFASNEFDAVTGFFKKRGFEENSAISIATVLLKQSKIENINVFQLIDTLKGVDDLQLSGVITEILNQQRPKTSFLGIKEDATVNRLEERNVIP